MIDTKSTLVCKTNIKNSEKKTGYHNQWWRRINQENLIFWEVTLLASTAFLKLYVPPGWCQMSNSTGKTDIPSQEMKVDSKQKTVPLGTNKFTTKLRILQWNAGGLSPTKMTELKQLTTQTDADILIINEANNTADNTQYYNIKDFTTYMLHKADK